MQGHINSSLESLVSTKSSKEVSCHVYEPSLFSPNDESAGANKAKVHSSEVRPIVDQESDDSDSEIFRVKRRPSAKGDQRDANDAISTSFEHQVW